MTTHLAAQYTVETVLSPTIPHLILILMGLSALVALAGVFGIWRRQRRRRLDTDTVTVTYSLLSVLAALMIALGVIFAAVPMTPHGTADDATRATKLIEKAWPTATFDKPVADPTDLLKASRWPMHLNSMNCELTTEVRDEFFQGPTWSAHMTCDGDRRVPVAGTI